MVKRAGKLKNAGARIENGVIRGLILSGKVVAQRAQGVAPRDTGRLKRSLTHSQPYVIVGRRSWGIDVGTNVVYAATQEFGLANQVITDKQRRFFWAKWAETGEPMWRALALSYDYTIPAHPYLRPALRASKDIIGRTILRSVAGALRAK